MVLGTRRFRGTLFEKQWYRMTPGICYYTASQKEEGELRDLNLDGSI
jgi:hypothetical protein